MAILGVYKYRDRSRSFEIILSYKSGQLFARKELLLLEAPLAFAPLASQGHLRGAVIPTAKMAGRKVRKTLDENLVSVETLNAPNARVVRVVDDLLIQLEESFDVVAGKCDGDQQ